MKFLFATVLPIIMVANAASFDMQQFQNDQRPQISVECKALVDEICPPSDDREADKQCRREAFDNGLVPEDCKPQRPQGGQGGQGSQQPRISEECKDLIDEICPPSDDRQVDKQCRREAFDNGLVPEDCKPQRPQQSQFSEECKALVDEICPPSDDMLADRECRKEAFENGLIPEDCKPQRKQRPRISEECKALVDEICPPSDDRQADKQCRREAFDNGLVPEDCKPQRPQGGQQRPRISEECKALVDEVCPPSDDMLADRECRKQAFENGLISEDCKPQRGNNGGNNGGNGDGRGGRGGRGN